MTEMTDVFAEIMEAFAELERKARPQMIVPMTEVFAELERRIKAKPQTVAGLSGVYQFNLTNAAWLDDDWTLTIASDGAILATRGTAQKPDTTLILSAIDWMKLVSGKLTMITAFMEQTLAVKGSMGMAIKLGELLR